jgi:hydrogenase expression/formation protein HypE
MALVHAARFGLRNFSLLVSHVLVPPAIRTLLSSPHNRVQGFIAPGHVCAVVGFRDYEILVREFWVPIVVGGFEPVDLLEAIRLLVVQLEEGRAEVENQYTRSVQYLNTTGIGFVRDGITLSASQARPGDSIIVSGTLGDHGIAILAEREGLQFETEVRSDSAALHTLVGQLFQCTREVRCLRDPTRGGLSSTLNEIAASSNVGMELQETTIPVKEQVRGACEILGLDPLYVANEGKLVAIVAPQVAAQALQAMQSHPLGKDARIIGSVTTEHPSMVVMRTPFGTTRIVDMLAGDQLPRIC